MSDTTLRAGVVGLLGWTNVGKSTLLNRLVGEKIAAVADVAQTTRSRITAVLHLPGRGQIVLHDTPGVHAPRSKLNVAMVAQIRRAAREVDLTALVVDAARGLGRGDRRAAEIARRAPASCVVVLNKIDLVRPKSRLLPLMRQAVEEWGFAEALPVSAATGEGCAELVERLLLRLPPSEPLYPEDYLTDQSLRALAAEWIREKLLARTRAELPHATAVLIEQWKERDDGLVEIHASILVDRPSQRAIVIGRQAQLLGEVGRTARLEIEALLGRRVALQLWVRVHPDWRNDEHVLRALGI